ncbi:MAG: hypothetical protein HXX20_12700 [Chloroflexi bacterium]|nr:hypothetical protein [Chloroflexota bacterium]
MLDFLIEDEQATLFEGTARIPDAKAAEFEENEALESTGTIGDLFRKESQFIIGDPIATPLELQGEQVAAEITAQLEHYDFFRVQLACSFLPANGCRYSSARFKVELLSAPTSPAAIVYDYFPPFTPDEAKAVKRFSLDLNLKLKVGTVPLLELSGLPFKYEKSQEFTVYTSRVEMAGLQTSQPIWNFSRTSSHELNGSYKLIMIVRKPKGSQVQARLSLSAETEVVLELGPLGPFPLTTTLRKGKTIVDEPEIPLC